MLRVLRRKRRPTSLLDLPPDVLQHILLFLPPDDIHALAWVSRALLRETEEHFRHAIASDFQAYAHLSPSSWGALHRGLPPAILSFVPPWFGPQIPSPRLHNPPTPPLARLAGAGTLALDIHGRAYHLSDASAKPIARDVSQIAAAHRTRLFLAEGRVWVDAPGCRPRALSPRGATHLAAGMDAAAAIVDGNVVFWPRLGAPLRLPLPKPAEAAVCVACTPTFVAATTATGDVWVYRDAWARTPLSSPHNEPASLVAGLRWTGASWNATEACHGYVGVICAGAPVFAEVDDGVRVLPFAPTPTPLPLTLAIAVPQTPLHWSPLAVLRTPNGVFRCELRDGAVHVSPLLLFAGRHSMHVLSLCVGTALVLVEAPLPQHLLARVRPSRRRSLR
ncbi:hypothetical protein CC85DRAFT_302435 [Cutaneotrichosporon oleaginosum]|uniref:F-box domain-containing protein n=1 Tax=Cutaneotrichosporon oleaginosum TaxID=879819 RepID=A0A0J0XMD7_9TREE|nr:uncharacterized protein CC85DRAFT_302435 [Cutaneotrichosporon oleaginosum]KLT42228.1 hypothetical protein CC85DRAFT_302435 [Cutaneotrichosporon oleaginosum]TXT11402.1 hypothetical protein COLE_01812 [Cutaneotrichosporon oleaginosum]